MFPEPNRAIAASPGVIARLNHPEKTPMSLSPLQLASWSLSLFLGLLAILFIFRIVLTWYPEADLKRLPFS
ncbi:MAG: hypothetical protein AAFY11_15130, partial [Cyanobacteria bacterium J06641_5]